MAQNTPCMTDEEIAQIPDSDEKQKLLLNGVPPAGTASCVALQKLAAFESSKGKGEGGGGSGWFGWVLGIGAQPLIGFWYALMYIAEIVLSTILAFVAFFLNNIFLYAVILNPVNMPVVVEGWVYLRDIANGLFILVVLWIALTIIFDREGYGGKKLLFRVIVVALLMNFSLALVSVVFGFANQLSLPFYNTIAKANNGDLAGLIIARTSIHTIFQTVGNKDRINAENQVLGIDSNNRCGFNALAPDAPNAKGCPFADSMSAAFAAKFIDGFTEGANLGFNTLNYTIALAIGVFLLAMVIAAFIGIAVTLLMRIIAMVFLGITAPIAFVAFIFPTGKMAGVGKQWFTKLFCWAFVAPAFYFLFYVSLRILIVMTSTPMTTVANMNITGNLINAIPFFVFFGFLWASITVGKRVGCGAGDIAADWGKKLGKAAVMGTAQLGLAAVSGGASVVAGRVAGTVAGAARGMATRPGIGRMVAGAVGPAADTLIRNRKTKIKEEKDRLKEVDDNDIVSSIRSPKIISNANKMIGQAQALLEKNSLHKLSIQERRNIKTLAEQVGAEKDFINADPTLALKLRAGEKITSTTDLKDMNTWIEKMKPKESEKINLRAMAQGRDDNEVDILYQNTFESMTRGGGPEHLKGFYDSLIELPREDREKVLKSWKAVVNNEQHWKEVQQNDPVLYNNHIRYIAGKAGRRWIDKDQTPDWLKAEAKRLDVEGWNPKQGRGQRGQGGGTQQPPKPPTQTPPTPPPQKNPPPTIQPPPTGFGGGPRQPPQPPQTQPPPPAPPVPPNPPGPGTASLNSFQENQITYADLPPQHTIHPRRADEEHRIQKINWMKKKKQDEIMRIHQSLLDKEAEILRAKIKQVESEYDELEEIK